MEKSKEGEPYWESPWGKGRPGWHIECSAMSCKHLGETFDIHAGGNDLIFPHHENEIAQTEAATGKPFVKYWMHNGYLTINNEKMSKSKGNFFTVSDILKRYSAEAIRMFFAQAYYRGAIRNWFCRIYWFEYVLLLRVVSNRGSSHDPAVRFLTAGRVALTLLKQQHNATRPQGGSERDRLPLVRTTAQGHASASSRIGRPASAGEVPPRRWLRLR